MSEKGRFINLKKEEAFIKQYVNLRNSYAENLLTSPVSMNETKAWLKRTDIEIRGFAEGNMLLGAVILYMNRGGEIAVFVRDSGKGIGSSLLNAIEKVAVEKKLTSIWAWTLTSNLKAQKVFAGSGYIMEGETGRRHNNKAVQGFVFRKKIIQD